MWRSGLTAEKQVNLVFTLLFLGSKDHFKRFSRFVRFFIKHMYPCPPYKIEEMELDEGIGFYYTKCPYPDFFSREGIPEFGEAMCNMDFRWSALLLTGVEMRRNHTLMEEGADCYDFRICKS